MFNNELRKNQAKEKNYKLSIIFFITYLIFIFPLEQCYLNYYMIQHTKNIYLYYGFNSKLFDTFQFNITPIPKSFAKCKLCNFIPQNGKTTPNSSARDVIMSFGANRLYGLFPFVKSLRTTRTKCRLFVLVNTQALQQYSNFYYRTADQCGVEFVNIGPVDVTRKAAMFLRYYMFRKFLIRNRKNIDRVIFCDLFDTVFQHDPFTVEFGDSIYFTDEGTALCDNLLNLRWLKSVCKYFKAHPDPEFSIILHKEFLKNVRKHNIVNGGLQAGTISLMIIYCTIMLKTGNKLTNELLFNDQGFLNLLIYSGYFKNKFNYTILPLTSDLFASISHYSDVIETEKSMKPIFGKVGKDKSIPAVLHQYDRSPKVQAQLVKVCPNEFSLQDYTRKRKKRFYIFKHGFNF